MSFTTELKDELARLKLEGRLEKEALFAALVYGLASKDAHLNSCLKKLGSEADANLEPEEDTTLELSFDSAALARLCIKLCAELSLGKTSLRLSARSSQDPRESTVPSGGRISAADKPGQSHNVAHHTQRPVLYRRKRYHIVCSKQSRIAACVIPYNKEKLEAHLASYEDCKARQMLFTYLRGAFLLSGYMSPPCKAAHLEFVFASYEHAQLIQKLLAQQGVALGLSMRREEALLYCKSYEDITCLLAHMGSSDCLARLHEARSVKELRNKVNRRVNAEIANQKKSSGAALHQLSLISFVEERLGLEGIPQALQSFCSLRKAHPDVSLRELGERARPPLSKSALNHRVRRLEELVLRLQGEQE